MNIWKPWKQTPSYKGEEKAESYNFFDISSFFRFDTHRNALGVLSDQTCSDLGFENLFMFSDRTASRVGQQYLYNLMRIIPDKAGEIERHEALINELSSHPDLQEELVKDLQILNTHEAYSIASLMGIGFPAVPVWRKILFRIWFPAGLVSSIVVLLSGGSVAAFVDCSDTCERRYSLREQTEQPEFSDIHSPTDTFAEYFGQTIEEPAFHGTRQRGSGGAVFIGNTEKGERPPADGIENGQRPGCHPLGDHGMRQDLLSGGTDRLS